jgi:ligand-binding SRPBCC domain-containing protein
MPKIELITKVNAPIAKVFDLARSIDLHMESTKQTNERAIAGKTSGLIGLGETVTWEATHFGIRQTLTSKITAFDYPHFFVDDMVQGAFKKIHHEHHFETVGHQTIMKDIFVFESPLGLLGIFFNWLILTGYMTNLLKKRNLVIKEAAEK